MEPLEDDGDVKEKILSLKDVLDSSQEVPSETLVNALRKLHALGALATHLLSETKIGITVNRLAKDAMASEAVRECARSLVDHWRQSYRKRKASALHSFSDSVMRSPCGGLASDSAPDLALEREFPSTDSKAGLSTCDSQSAPAGLQSNKREKVRQKLVEALQKAEEMEKRAEHRPDPLGFEDLQLPNPRNLVELATSIEQALHKYLQEAAGDKEYMNQVRALIFNLKDSDNHRFRYKILGGMHRPEQVPRLTAADMASDAKTAERARFRKEAAEERDLDWAKKRGGLNVSGSFTCGKCKGTKTTYFQLQTRSSDEPMTTFVTCLTCNNRWKFC